MFKRLKKIEFIRMQITVLSIVIFEICSKINFEFLFDHLISRNCNYTKSYEQLK